MDKRLAELSHYTYMLAAFDFANADPIPKIRALHADGITGQNAIRAMRDWLGYMCMRNMPMATPSDDALHVFATILVREYENETEFNKTLESIGITIQGSRA